jgi:AraC-like DNA-binding protein
VTVLAAERPAVALGGVPLDLAPLYQRQLLVSQDRRASYDAVTNELCGYDMRWGGGEVDAQVYGLRTNGVSIYSVGYGDEVLITPDVYADFILLRASLRAGMDVEADGTTLSVPEGAVCINSPRRRIRLRWQQGTEQLIVRIPMALLGPNRRLNGSAALLPQSLTGIFAHQLNTLLALANSPLPHPKDRLWQAHLSAGLAHFVAAQLMGGREQEPSHETDAPCFAWEGGEHAEHLDAYIADHLDEPIRLLDLMRATGISRSRLSEIAHDRFGCSPMALVRRRRLQAARRELEADPTQGLTSVCTRFGFEHQSRFAQYYRAEFGELPRETRARLRIAAR